MKIDRSPYFCGLLAVVALATGIDATAPDHPGHRPGAPEHDLTKKMTLFPQRDASGTGWQPDVTPMNAVHRDLGASTGAAGSTSSASLPTICMCTKTKIRAAMVAGSGRVSPGLGVFLNLQPSR